MRRAAKGPLQYQCSTARIILKVLVMVEHLLNR